MRIKSLHAARTFLREKVRGHAVRHIFRFSQAHECARTIIETERLDCIPTLQAFNDEAQRRTYQFTWNGRNHAGEIVTTGTYYAVFKTAKQRYTLKLLVVK